MKVIDAITLTFTATWLMQSGGVAAQCSWPVSHYCPPPWLAFHGHCYLWVDRYMSWMDAEHHCQMLSDQLKMTSHLVSIHHSDEEEFISKYVRKVSGLWPVPDYWIGYNDIDREGQFQWTDGSDGSYEGWDPREPNGAQEDCVERRSEYNGMWNDLSCGSKIQFVCKM